MSTPQDSFLAGIMRRAAQRNLQHPPDGASSTDDNAAAGRRKATDSGSADGGSADGGSADSESTSDSSSTDFPLSSSFPAASRTHSIARRRDRNVIRADTNVDHSAVALIGQMRQKNIPQFIRGICGALEIVPMGAALCFEKCTQASIQVRAPLRRAGCRVPELARIVFMRCRDCRIVIDAKIMGALEVFACEDTAIELRAPCGTIQIEHSPRTTVAFPPPAAGGARPVLVNRGCAQPFRLQSAPVAVPAAPSRHAAAHTHAAARSDNSAEIAELAAILNRPAPLEPSAIFYDDKVAPASRAWVCLPLALLCERDPAAVAAVKATGRRTPPPYKYYVFEVPDWRRRD